MRARPPVNSRLLAVVAALVALVAAASLVASTVATIPGGDTLAAYGYDDPPTRVDVERATRPDGNEEQALRGHAAPSVERVQRYDDRSNLARTLSRLDGLRLAPNTAGFVDDAVRINRHHTVPREILRDLPDDVASNPLVRGRAGAPNRWAIPEDVHRAIHQGPGGGLYNEAWKAELRALNGPATVDDILRLRDQITKQFGIDIYRPGGGGL